MKPIVRFSARSLAGLILALALGLVMVGSMLAVPPAQASDTVTRWSSFAESSNCGSSYTRPPYASKKGSLPNSQPLLGPFGAYFGRSIGEIRSQLVWWQVPFSGGKRVQVHREALPAFNHVAQMLSAEAANGRVYHVKVVSAFVPRTIGGSHQVSRHSLGTTIDINPAQNPFRSDRKLITDMPDWYVDVWREAGFCWGGDWRYSKDPMHFSWTGPDGAWDLAPAAPETSLKAFGSPAETRATVLAPVLGRYALAIGDGIGNGAPDVFGVREHSGGTVVDMASGTEAFGYCSVRRWFVSDDSLLDGDHTLMADVDGDTGDDIVVLEEKGSGVTLGVATRQAGFADATFKSIPLPAGVVAATGADFNGDHFADLWAVSGDGTLTILEGPSFDAVAHSSALPSGAPAHIAASDRDGGNVPELFAVYEDAGAPLLEVLRLGSTWSVDQAITIGGPVLAVGAIDYDGDGRADFQSFLGNGRLEAYLGNTSTGAPVSTWFVNPDYDCDSPIILDFEGTFYDDDSSVHSNGIEMIAAEGITQGCNPPYNDRFCPGSTLTRAQAATFVARAIDLAPSETDFFIDDDGHVLEGAVNRVAAVGITQGCDPPANERFCPDREMTRAEFAAFLARSLNLPPADFDYFTDDDGMVLEGAINRLAASGITRGCNPPDNNEFCPDRHLTRAQAATFLARAFG